MHGDQDDLQRKLKQIQTLIMMPQFRCEVLDHDASSSPASVTDGDVRNSVSASCQSVTIMPEATATSPEGEAARSIAESAGGATSSLRPVGAMASNTETSAGVSVPRVATSDDSSTVVSPSHVTNGAHAADSNRDSETPIAQKFCAVLSPLPMLAETASYVIRGKVIPSDDKSDGIFFLDYHDEDPETLETWQLSAGLLLEKVQRDTIDFSNKHAVIIAVPFLRSGTIEESKLRVLRKVGVFKSVASAHIQTPTVFVEHPEAVAAIRRAASTLATITVQIQPKSAALQSTSHEAVPADRSTEIFSRADWLEHCLKTMVPLKALLKQRSTKIITPAEIEEHAKLKFTTEWETRSLELEQRNAQLLYQQHGFVPSDKELVEIVCCVCERKKKCRAGTRLFRSRFTWHTCKPDEEKTTSTLSEYAKIMLQYVRGGTSDDTPAAAATDDRDHDTSSHVRMDDSEDLSSSNTSAMVTEEHITAAMLPTPPPPVGQA